MNARSGLSVAAAPTIDIVVQSPLWASEPKAETILRRAIALAAEGRTSAQDEVAVILTDDAAIRKLNREWRGFDKPTNVLSFPTQDRRAGAPAGPALLGDIVISYETTAREALAQSKPFSHHLAHLAVHGFLHLLGYDHDSDTAAWEMEHLEARILAALDVPDPYLLRDAGA
jgi:probable rRNA maturation factor